MSIYEALGDLYVILATAVFTVEVFYLAIKAVSTFVKNAARGEREAQLDVWNAETNYLERKR